MNDPHQLRLVTEDDTPAGPAPMVPPATDPPSADRARHTVMLSLDDYGDVLTVEEAAAVLRISRGSAYDAARLWRATRAEGLPVIQIGRRLLVPRTALEMILAGPAQLYAEAASPSDD